jgi:hypothetical protein
LIQKSTIEKEASNAKPKHLANLQITYPIGLIQKSTIKKEAGNAKPKHLAKPCIPAGSPRK